MLATLLKTTKRTSAPIRLFSTAQQPKQVDEYFIKLDALAKERNESDQAYDAYMKHLE